MVLSLVTLLLSASDDFAVVRRERDGLVLAKRPAAQSEFEELRVEGDTDASPESLSDIIWNDRARSDVKTYLAHRQIVQVEAQKRIERQLVDAPIIGKRDSLVRFERHTEADGTIVISWTLGGKPENAKAETMKLQRGAWRLTPKPGGGTRVEFRTIADPGGVPALFAISPQRDVALSIVRAVLEAS